MTCANAGQGPWCGPAAIGSHWLLSLRLAPSITQPIGMPKRSVAIDHKGVPFRYSLITRARAARGAPRPGWVGIAALHALAAELAGFVRPCAATCRSRARRRRPGAAACGTAGRGLREFLRLHVGIQERREALRARIR